MADFDIYSGCTWNIILNGVTLDLTRKLCVKSFSIKETCKGSNSVTISIADPDFLYIEDNIFVEEATVAINVAWSSDTHIIKFNGYVSAIDIDFTSNGSPEISMFCMDNSHLMNRKKKKRSWDKLTRPDVVRKIAAEYGFKCVVETGYSFKTEDTISQSNQTDIDFLESLAGQETYPFMCKLVGDTIRYVKLGVLSKPVDTLYYREGTFDVVSFKPQITKETIAEEVSTSDVTANTKAVTTSTASSKTTSQAQGSSVTTSSTPTGSNSSKSSSGSSSSSSKKLVYNSKTDTWS